MTTLAKWTLQDYHRMIETGILCDRNVELIEGEIIETTPEKPLHISTNIKLELTKGTVTPLSFRNIEIEVNQILIIN